MNFVSGIILDQILRSQITQITNKIAGYFKNSFRILGEDTRLRKKEKKTFLTLSTLDKIQQNFKSLIFSPRLHWNVKKTSYATVPF